jgi:uncharacterized protein
VGAGLGGCAGGTGEPAALADVGRIRRVLPDAPILVGSGVVADTVREVLEEADGVIVGSDLRVDGLAGQPVDPARVRRLVAAARG